MLRADHYRLFPLYLRGSGYVTFHVFFQHELAERLHSFDEGFLSLWELYLQSAVRETEFITLGRYIGGDSVYEDVCNDVLNKRFVNLNHIELQGWGPKEGKQ